MGGFRPVDVAGARQPGGCEGEQDDRGNHAGGDPCGAVARWTGGFGPRLLPERGGHRAIVDTAGITGSLRPVSKCNGASGRGAGYAAGSLGPLLRHVNRAHAQPTSGSGSAGTPPTWSWKWRCDPTERPVLPTDPTLWPCWTSSPTLTAVSSMWA